MKTLRKTTAALALLLALTFAMAGCTGGTGGRMDEKEAEDTFWGLYDPGYDMLMHIYWGVVHDYSTTIEQGGTTYYLLQGYTTREEMETAYARYFSPEFMQRNISAMFDGGHYFHIIEQDGALYITVEGGLGGTWRLWTDEVQVDIRSADEMAFTLYDYDSYTDEPLYNMTWTFVLCNTADGWRIDEINVRYADGQGGWSGYSY